MFDELPDTDVSEFNGGIAMIYRLDAIHKQIHLAAMARNHHVWYELLARLFSELSRIIKRDAKNGEVSEFDDQLVLWQKVKEAYFKIEAIKRNKKDVDAGLYEPFYYWEIELNSLEQKYGLGVPTKADPRFAMAGR